MTNLIRFETFQLVTFVLGLSLFVYMTGSIITWFRNQVIPKKPGYMTKIGGRPL